MMNSFKKLLTYFGKASTSGLPLLIQNSGDTSMATITEIFKAQKSRVGRSKKPSQTPVVKAEIEEVEKVDPNQQDLDLLRQFDLDSRFGPCTGISRLQRWERAAKFGFDPPKRVRDVVLQHKDDTKFTESVWFGMKI